LVSDTFRSFDKADAIASLLTKKIRGEGDWLVAVVQTPEPATDSIGFIARFPL